IVWNPATRQFNAPHGAGGEHATTPATHGETAATPNAHGEPATTTDAHGEPTATATHSDAAPATQIAHDLTGEREPHAPYGNNTGFNLAHSVESSLGERGTEWLFIVISLVAAGIGMGLGYLFYVKNPRLPEVWAARLGALYRASYNKYWVDELYGLLFTRRTMDAARGVYAADSKGIDGAVNGSAWLTRRVSNYTGVFDRVVVDGVVNGVAGFIGRLMSPLLRAAQTGLTANYALVMVLGLVVAVALFFGADILSVVRGR
ncbi:MAG TPA: hypothetical protein VJT82_01865, partial [Pyrinomonadaceae bacterium]|nr:hypothetical protein [Pyrinomonadaceae bacterium]